MQIPKKILKELIKKVEDMGIMAVCDGSGANYRTVDKAVMTGECSPKVFAKISGFLVEQKKKISRIENQLT